ncbi:very short patch repair endonuclease [Photobacterium chitinilyticum]|uniref:very short patch repair endonuclease n=1 Tax=Photobacterium chitinilyticum TaxID=2485123 RepID=UPI003D1484FC
MHAREYLCSTYTCIEVGFDDDLQVLVMPDMRLFHSKNTKLEVDLRKFLFARGFRYRLHDKRLKGTPDLVFPKYKAVIFVHGCFWHAHENCSHASIPKTNTEFWLEKFAKNKERDEKAHKWLEDNGWRVLTLWECAIKYPQYFTLDDLLEYIECWLVGEAASCELLGSEKLPILNIFH